MGDKATRPNRNHQMIENALRSKGYHFFGALWEPIGRGLEMCGPSGGWSVIYNNDGGVLVDHLFGYSISEVLESIERLPPIRGAIEMNTTTVAYSIFKVNDDYIVAETQEQAIQHHLEAVGQNWYKLGEELDVEVIPHDRHGRFENEQGGYDEMTFGEWLAGFEYTGPQLLCWNE